MAEVGSPSPTGWSRIGALPVVVEEPDDIAEKAVCRELTLNRGPSE